jgi:hypothetical protein
VPYATYSPGLDRPDLDNDQVEAIDRILAAETAYGDGDLSVIDPFTGVLPSVNPTGMNRRPWCEVRLEVYYAQERIDRGPDCANAIADQVASVVGYRTTVWMNVGGTFFQGDSERNDDH